MGKISPAQCFVTVHDMDDGFGRGAGACQQYTQPRDDVPVGWIRGQTKIGPVRQVKVTYHSEQHGIEIQVKSMQNDGSLSCIVICRGMKRYVEKKIRKEMATGPGTEKPVATTKGAIKSTNKSFLQDVRAN